MNATKFLDSYKNQMRALGIDLIQFYSDMGEKIIEDVESNSSIKLEKPYALLLIEAARRQCLPQMITILSFLICKDAEQFTQISKQSSFTKFLSQIFGDQFNFGLLRMQSDPLYYLEIANKIEKNEDSIKMSTQCAKLFNLIFNVKQSLEECVMSFLQEFIPRSNEEPIIGIKESLKREGIDRVSLQIRYCFLAVYSTNLCTKAQQSVPFLVFKGKNLESHVYQDSFLDVIPNSEFFILSTLEGSMNMGYHPWVVNFTEEELSDQRLFTQEQYQILSDYLMVETIEISYPNSLRPDLLAHLQQRMDRKVKKIIQGEFLQGRTVQTPNELILTIISRRRGMERLLDSNLAEEEQGVIQLFTQNQMNNTEALIQTDYMDDEHKCIFSFGNGLKAVTWMLPNEYDSIKIQNFPGDELSLFEHFSLNQKALCSINKSGDAFIVKCKNKQLSVQFLQHIQQNDFVLDKTNRVIVKPVIIENLHTTVTRIILIVKYKPLYVEYDELKAISQCLDTLIKGEYEIKASLQQVDLLTQEKTCYLIMESDERAEFVIQTLKGQQSEKILFSSMKKEIMKQGKLDLHIQVFKLFETILRNIKSTEFNIIFPNETTFTQEVSTVNLLHIEKKQVTKEVIRLLGKEQMQFQKQFQANQSAETVELLISGNSEKEISRAISELKILTRPKQVLQFKDSFQFLIFQDEKGREYLKNLSISNNLFIVFNSALNRLEFYSKTTAQKSKQTIDTVTESITGFIDNSLVNLRFSVKPDVSAKMLEYLRSKKFAVEVKPGLIKTKIKYSQLIKEREHIKDNFLKGHEDEDCQICFGSSTIYKLSLCGCKAACKSCIKAHIRDAAISSLTDFKPEIMCPICSKSPISISDINDIFDKVSLTSIFKIRFKSSIEGLKYEDQVPLFMGCQTPDCKGLLQISDQLQFANPQTWRCLLCQTEFCIKHIINKEFSIPLHEVHGNEISCKAQASDSGTDDLVQAGLIKKCPKCNNKFSHEEGCNHLTCPQCKCHFCAICDFYEEQYKNIYNHLNEKHGGHSKQKAKYMGTVNKEELEKIQNKNKKDKSGESVIQDESVFNKFGIVPTELKEIEISNLGGADPDLVAAISFGQEKENCHFNTSDLFD